MKNLTESFAIGIVVFLFVAVLSLIVLYNLIGEDVNIEQVALQAPYKKATSKASANDYLDSLEGYGDDTDVKVDAKKEDTTNTILVQSESNKNILDSVVEDKSKNSYMQNLENYTDKVENEKLDEAKPVVDHLGEPERLPQEEVVDEIGIAIDAALDGI